MKKIFGAVRLSNIIMLLFAGIINAVGVNMFLGPVHIYDSGLSGTAMLFGQITPPWLSLSVFLIILNVPFFLYGARKQGALFTTYSVFAVSVYAVTSYLIIFVLPIDVITSSPFAGQDLFLCAIFGGMISGIGSGLTIRFGGAMDGIDVMAVIFAKKLNMTVGTFVMVYNSLLYIAAGIIMHSWSLPLYSVVAYAVAIKTIDFIIDGLDKAKSAVIITKKEQELCKALCDTLGHGVTLMDAHGYYSGKHKSFVYVVVNRFQVAKLKNIVAEIDPKAFVTISDVSDVLGSSVKVRKTKIPIVEENKYENADS